MILFFVPNNFHVTRTAYKKTLQCLRVSIHGKRFMGKYVLIIIIIIVHQYS